MNEESMEVAPNEDNGNIPVDASNVPNPEPSAEPQAPATEAQPVVEEPAVPAEPPVATATQPVLYDLPDGRQVDAETLQKEWKENFLPEFTRKSQELAQLKEPPQPNNLPSENQNPYADPNYVPKSYDEVISEAEQRVINRLQAEQRQQQEFQQSIETKVATDIATIKAGDPNVNVDQLFLHANKYGFNDLHAAHKNMQDMANLVKTVQTQTANNITKRADPVSTSSQPSGTKPNPANYATATDYLNAIKDQS